MKEPCRGAWSMVGGWLCLAPALAAALVLSAAAPAMAQVAVLDAWPANPQIQDATGTATPAGAFAISAGTNRLLLVSVNPGYTGNNPGTTVTVTYGGRTLTQIQTSDNTQRRFTWLGYLNEAGIAARVGNAIQVTLSNNTNLAGTNVYIASYSGVSQTAPITASGNNYINNGNPVTLGAALAVNAGGYGVFAVHVNNATNPADVGGDAYPFSNGVQSDSSSSYSRVGARAFGAATTTNIRLYTVNVRSGVVGATLNPAPTTADVSITKTASAGPIYLGDTFSYTITVANSGPLSATNVTVTDVLPGVLLQSATSSQGTCSGTTTVTCALGTINNGSSATITISVQAKVLGTVSNTASVTATEPDPNSANNSSTVSTTVLQINTADVSILKTATASVLLGGNATYTLTVHNNGPDTANGVTVTDPLPGGVTLFSLPTTTVGTCTGAVGSTLVTCNLGNLANGATATITIVAAVSSPGAHLNTATLALDTVSTYDSNPTNNTSSANTTVSNAAAPTCNVPNTIGPGGTLSGVINTYHPGTASVAAGATSIPLGPARAAVGAQVLTAIAAGDLVLVIQMQDAQINSSDTDCYGAGTGCQNLIGGTGPGAGATAGTVNAGKYEFARATGGVSLAAGGTLTVSDPLVNAYTNADATTTKGQARFQVVRVAEYTTATLNGVTAAPWATTTTAPIGLGTGGIVALDVAGSLTINSGVAASVDGLGFRGAPGRVLGGEAGTCNLDAVTTVTPDGQDWRGPTGTGFADPCDTHGGKGEGNAGTPEWVLDPAGSHTACGGANTYLVQTNQPNDGYPNGSMARGAPGSAGGGSTDPNPPANDQNSGGGGGSNGGAGGTGGHSWNSNLDRGGRGAAVTPALSQLVLGGGGGAGTRNNDSCVADAAVTLAQDALASSGAAGGGLLLIQAGSLTVNGGATLTANGSDAYDDTLNDGGGGGGAGGSVVLTVTTGTMSGLSIQAHGGRGGSAWKTNTGGTANRHGPGGGGGGGVIAFTNTAVAPTLDVAGGAAGITTTLNDNYGALAGGAGKTLFAGAGQIPGVGSAADCASDPAMSLAHFPATTGSGLNVAFVATVTNVAPFVSTSGAVSVTITLDPGLIFAGLASGAGWTCATPVGQSVTCTRSDALVPGTSYPINFNATVVAGGPAALSGNSATVTNAGDPNASNNTATDTVGVTTPTLAHVRSFQAVRSGGVIHLSWETSFESRNLGFRIYRDRGGSRQMLTPSLIAGSALFVGKQPLHSGRSYAWVDRQPGADPVYWLEDVDVSGARGWTGPASPQDPDVAVAAPVATQAMLLKTLGRPDAARVPASPAPGLGRDRRAASTATKSLVRQWQPPSRRAAKLLVGQEGWYSVTKARLIAAGFDPGTDPSQLQLVSAGIPQAILVRDGGDGSFDPSDSIEFYGVGFDSSYDDTHVYWVVVGAGPGPRIQTDPPVGGSPPPQNFPFTVERRDRTVYFAALTNNGDAENFFGAVVTPDPVAEDLAVSHLDVAEPGDSTLTVALQGVTTDSFHDVRVILNGQDVGQMLFMTQEHRVQEFSVPSAWLREGANEVQLVAQGGDDDISVVDFVQLTYPHLYQLDAHALRMTAPTGTSVTISGLVDSSMRVVDVTNAARPAELSVSFSSQGATVAGAFGVSGADPATLLAFTPDRVLSPAVVVPGRSSTLPKPQTGADFVIIAHPTLIAGLQPLKALRTAHGLVTSIVDVNDIYDAFASGQKTPYAIRAFLSRAARTWRRRPRYVLMAGDASLDPKNYLGFGDLDLVPTKLIPTAYLKTDSDDWFVDFNDDGLPDLAIGRLPARTPEEASLIVSKILAHDVVQGGAQWRQSILLVSDRPAEYDFDAASRQVHALVPNGFSVQQVSLSQLNGGTRDAIAASLDAGQLLVNYIGHGSEAVWSQEAIFTGADATALTNGGRLPVVVAMTCLNGMFSDVYVEGLAKAFVKAPKGGAVAVWASSALTEPEPQAQMNLELFRLLFHGPSITVGEAVARAKSVVSDQDVRRTWIFFGDPTMRLQTFVRPRRRLR